MTGDKGVVSQLAVVLLGAARLLFLRAARVVALVFLDAIAGGDGWAGLCFLLTFLLTALARSRLEFLHLSLTIGAQGGQASLFRGAVGRELGTFLGVGGASAVQQGAFASDDGLFVGAAFQTFVFPLVLASAFFTTTRRIAFATLGREGESGNGLFDASFEFAL